MTKIKIAMLALLLAGATNLPAPPPYPNCTQQTAGWYATTTQIPGAWQFTVAAGSLYTGMSLTRNGAPFGSTTGKTLYCPNWTGTYVVTATTADCRVHWTFYY